MAVNCSVAPLEIIGFVGVTAIDVSVTSVTVNVVLPETVPKVAVMVVVPAPMDVASPVLLIVATSAFDEPQVIPIGVKVT